MLLEHALPALRAGCRLTRSGWSGVGMFVYLVPGSRLPGIDYLPHVDMMTTHGDLVPWVCSQEDLLADDWLLIGGGDSRVSCAGLQT